MIEQSNLSNEALASWLKGLAQLLEEQKIPEDPRPHYLRVAANRLLSHDAFVTHITTEFAQLDVRVQKLESKLVK